jgi:hypothetical protein
VFTNKSSVLKVQKTVFTLGIQGFLPASLKQTPLRQEEKIVLLYQLTCMPTRVSLCHAQKLSYNYYSIPAESLQDINLTN